MFSFFSQHCVHYLNQWRILINWKLRHKFRRNQNQNTIIFINENKFETTVCQKWCNFAFSSMCELILGKGLREIRRHTIIRRRVGTSHTYVYTMSAATVNRRILVSYTISRRSWLFARGDIQGADISVNQPGAFIMRNFVLKFHIN